MHRLLALRARLRGSSRHIRADDSRPRIRLEGWNGRRRFPVVRMRLLRRLRASVPHSDAQRKTGHRKGNAGAYVVTTCAYCGVGCSFKAELKGDEVLRMI